jgi:DNA invertase Pin-like site-specific DNA recombinase
MVRGMGKRSPTTRTRPLALAYIRVSTSEQADGGASLTAQREALTAEAARRGWDLEVVADEGYSAATVDKRPGLVAALARLDAGQADALLSLRVDRLSRSVSDFAGLMARARRRGWDLVVLDLGIDTASPSGALMAHVLSSVAEYERAVIGQRTREGMAVRKAEGVHVGRHRSLPMSVVAQIVSDHRAGKGPTAIARKLNEAGTPTAQGGAQWYGGTVAKVLKSSTAERLMAATPAG